jgi:hypothetical protein
MYNVTFRALVTFDKNEDWDLDYCNSNNKNKEKTTKCGKKSAFIKLE